MKRSAVFLPPGEGRSYPMGRIGAVFKADGSRDAGRLFDFRVVAGASHLGPGRAPPRR